MRLFSFSKKSNRVIPTLPSTIPPRQNLYSAYNRLIPSPPPPPFIEDNGRSYSKNITRQYRENNDIEKYNHQKMMITEEERQEKMNKISYSRIFCCVCFPCLPMWTRTICCFIFLGLCGIIGLVVFFVLSFKKPQIVFVGNDQHLSSANANTPEDLRFEYNVYNSNFFEFDFDNIKAVIYYATPNKTTVGVGEIYDLVLAPQTVTNITFPVKIMSDGYNNSSSILDNKENSNSTSSSDEAFRNMVINSCSRESNGDSEGSNNHKEIVVMFDLMPTIRIYNYPIVTLAFTEQKTKMSCDKLNSFMHTKDKRIT